MSKSSLLKNARNYAEYLRKKERGPVKAFFHITKNENVPAIEQQGLLTNHPNANVNSAAHPFRKHGTDAGGVWVTTEPTAFPVYGTTIGGKNGNSAARADALSTIKIEVPLPELSKMKAVQDPYGRNILRKGNDPRAVEKFPTWAGIDVPSTVLLNDVKPQWLKNIGYVEELNPSLTSLQSAPLAHREADARFIRKHDAFQLNRADRHALSGKTGHRIDNHNHMTFNMAKSPARFVEDYLNKNQPIKERLPQLPDYNNSSSGILQFTPDQFKTSVLSGSDHYKTQLTRQLPTAEDWTIEFKPYTKPGEAQKKITFQPGAYSRGMGTIPIENIRINKNMGDEIIGRHFNWDAYLNSLQAGKTPEGAAIDAAPRYYLDWDNIVYNPKSGYAPNKVRPKNTNFKFNVGHISAGEPRGRVQDVVTGEYLVNPYHQGATEQFHQLGPGDIESLKNYKAYDDIVKDKDHPTWQELVRTIMRINAETGMPR